MQREVIYLGYEISVGQGTLGQAQKETIAKHQSHRLYKN